MAGRLSIWRGFAHDLAVPPACFLVRQARLVMLLALANISLFLLPALVDSLQAPLGRALARSDWLAANEHKDRVRVAGGEDAQAHPAAALDRDIEGNGLLRPIGDNFFSFHRPSVDDHFHRDAPRLAYSRSLDKSLWFLEAHLQG